MNATMARAHLAYVLAGIGAAALLLLPVLGSRAGCKFEYVYVCNGAVPSSEPRECPKCPSITAMQWLHDTVDAHPWLTVVFASVCNLLRLTGGVHAAMAVDYVVMPAYVAIRGHHRWRMLTDCVYELAGVLLVSIMQCVTLPMVCAACRGAVKYFAAPRVPPPADDAPAAPTDVDKGNSHTCESMVQSTGKPCDRRSTGRRDGRWVCGTHERAKRVHFAEKK